MLVLTRRIGETIMIGDNACVTVLGFKRGQIRLGVTAPKELPVDREEVYKRKKSHICEAVTSHQLTGNTKALKNKRNES